VEHGALFSKRGARGEHRTQHCRQPRFVGDKIESALLETGLRDSASEFEAENAQRSADLVFNVDLFNQQRFAVREKRPPGSLCF
jgi:hypothetical protein